MTGQTYGLSWAEASSLHLTGRQCLWQDLDGLHCEPAPPVAPLTSVLWGWSPTGDPDAPPVRLRIDRDGDQVRVFAAAFTGTDPGAEVTTVDPGRDQRVAGIRLAGATNLTDLRLRAVTDNPGTAGAALTFLYRAV